MEGAGWVGPERRRWRRGQVSLRAVLRVIHARDSSKVSSPKVVRVINLSSQGACIEAPFISVDGLHISGDRTEQVWMPNLLDIELELPTQPSSRINFKGSVEWSAGW